MSCPDDFVLFQLREGGLEAGDEQAAVDHLAGCPLCQGRMAELDALSTALTDPEPVLERERAAFVAEVVRRLDASGGAAAAAAPRGPRWGVVVPAVAAACCGLVALIVVPSFFTMGREASPPLARMEEGEAALQAAAPGQAAPAEPQAEPSVSALFRTTEVLGAPRAAGDLEATGGGAAGDDLGGLRGRLGGVAGAPAPERPTKSVVRRREAPDRSASVGSPRPASPLKAAQGAVPPSGTALTEMDRRSSSGLVFPSGGTGSRGGWSQPHVATTTARAVAIDPNGRFATTYRPGRGHLWRFESAMFRGQVPEPALALVTDVGGGAGPAVPAPGDRALALGVSAELGELSPEGGAVHLAVTLRSTERAAAGRAEMAVHLVVDTSGSMAGAAIEHARQAAARLVGMLEGGDRFSLVVYSSDARVLVADGPVGPRRAEILGQVGTMSAGGGTNLEAGLRLGYGQARASRQGRDSVQLVVVLSDGRANQGMTDPWGLSEMAAAAFQEGFETTTVGGGDDYDPLVMSTIAEYGDGGYYYLPDGSTIEQVLRSELEVRTQPVARGVELRVRLAEGVELLQVYGSRRLSELEAQRVRSAEVAIDHQAAHRDGISRDREHDQEGGMRFFIPGFARDDQHTVLLRLRVAGGVPGARAVLADVELRYKDRITLGNGGDERRVERVYGASAAAARASQDRGVRRAVLAFRTGEALGAVSTMVASGQQSGALSLLHERARLLRAASGELGDRAMAAEADRLDAFAGVLATQGIGNRLMLGAIVQRASSGMMR